MLPKAWKPAPVVELRRIGPVADGGYVIAPAAVAASDVLLSMGLNDDWRFEEEFQRVSGASVICYDGSVDRRFWQLYVVKKLLRFRPWQALHYWDYRRFFKSGRAEHRRSMIGYDGEGAVSLSTILHDLSSDHVFLKIDIEGWEYRILDQIVQHRDRFTGIVMELHDVDLHRAIIDRFLREMTGYTIVYLTANNFAGADPSGDPIVIEISLMRDAYVSRPLKPADAAIIPHVLNTTNREELLVRYA